MNFRYDGEEVAHETEVDATGTATTSKWTTHSDGTDDLIAVTLQAGTGPSSPTATTTGAAMPSASSFHYHTDHQGSVRAITDQSGTITNAYAYAYDSYGTAQESVESLAQRFRYTGREFDTLTGLYHYRARAYDPQTARFLQEDPLWFEAMHPVRGVHIGNEAPKNGQLAGITLTYASELNVYRYASSNPILFTDPNGKWPTYAGAVARTRTILQGINLGIRRATATLPRNSAGRLFNPFNGRFMSETAQSGGKAGAVRSCLEGIAAARLDTGTQEAPSPSNGWSYLGCFLAAKLSEQFGF